MPVTASRGSLKVNGSNSIQVLSAKQRAEHLSQQNVFRRYAIALSGFLRIFSGDFERGAANIDTAYG
jgi:hypothetical protein